MRAGDRKHPVRLQQNDAGVDTLGQPKPESWVTFGPDPIWARRIDLAASRKSERFSENEKVAQAEVAWEIPYSAAAAGVTAQNAVLEIDSGIRWAVLHIAPIGYRQGLRILTRARVD